MVCRPPATTIMSLKDLKNTLKLCTSLTSSSSLSVPFQLDDEDAHQRPQRKPPKSSLKQQLAGLEHLAADLDTRTNPSTVSERQQNAGDVLSSKPVAKKRWTFSGTEDTALAESWEHEKPSKDEEEVADSEAGVFVQPHTEGPFEPLLLSPPHHHSDHSQVVQVPASINCRLLEHQRAGVKFLYKLYKENHGGVLGDDMGLGKTIQTIAFLAAVLQKDTESDDFVTPWSTRRMNLKKHVENKKVVLIICPTSVLRNWETEFHEWGTFNVAIYHGPNRELVLEKLETSDVEIVLTSFDTFRIHGESLCKVQWEIVIVDEAHRLKNERSQLYKACLRIKTKKRYGLSGTIVQNKIMDLFNVFDWVAPGCLGTRDHFREFYDEPLKQGQRISAPERFVSIAEERKQHLMSVSQKYLLRRTKEETIGHLMMGKEDNVVFCTMSSLQRRVYRRLLDSPDFQCLITKDLPCSCGSPLTRVECCHRTAPEGIIWSYLHRDNPDGCDSCPFCLVLPCLVKLQQVSNHLELVKPNPKDDPEKQKKDEALAVAVFQNDAGLIGGTAQDECFMSLSDAQHCGKMRALAKLMSSWITQGDKVLLFSYSVRMLDILEKFLIRKGYCFSRLDGSTPMSSRQSLVDDFNNSPSKQVFLISTRAGGLGLNLASANRVVIFDPNWNPAQDLQAQDRSFRYGQKRHVTVFRLLAAGSLEELVYTRQIYKQQLFNIAVSGNLEKRYFEGVQDSKEFKGELFGICNLFQDLSDKVFTSDIVELHEERMQGFGYHVATGNGQVTVTAPSVDQQMGMSEKAINSVLTEQPEAIPAISGKDVFISKGKHKDNLPKLADVLSDAGVIYVHRNEDVVNFGVHNLDGCAEEGDDLKPNELEARHLRKMDSKPPMANEKTKESKKPLVSRKVGVTTDKKLDKTKQYKQLAQFKGMSELEFSKWLLSAFPSERDNLLADYQKWIENSKD